MGAGPAGLTAAYYLAKKGHEVTVFEKNPKAGGQCRYGIPAYRLPDSLLDRELHTILEAGIELKRVNVGNMHYEKGRVAFNRKVYLTQLDIEDINYMISQGTEVFYQDVPGSAVEKFSELDYETMKRRR